MRAHHERGPDSWPAAGPCSWRVSGILRLCRSLTAVFQLGADQQASRLTVLCEQGSSSDAFDAVVEPPPPPPPPDAIALLGASGVSSSCMSRMKPMTIS